MLSRWFLFVAMAGVAGCVDTRLPDAPVLRTGLLSDPGIPIEPRPVCSGDVEAAMATGTPEAIAHAAALNADFTCGSPDDPLPLDRAVIANAPRLVRALLEAGAKPDARWSNHGDHFPLQFAIETMTWSRPSSHRYELIRLLLQAGADPNARWCPFESRVGSREFPGCVSRWGATPLLYATMRDEAALVHLLLEFGADPALEDQGG